ncbi:MAG: hypothetical protein H0S79_01155 [Anaerolineaceae bacterium]|nr:hypothetical protein [Anaerolineaceae bacterium]
MRHDDDIGTFACGCGNKELITDAGNILDDQFNIVFSQEISSQVIQDWSTLFIGPNPEGCYWLSHRFFCYDFGRGFSHDISWFFHNGCFSCWRASCEHH